MMPLGLRISRRNGWRILWDISMVSRVTLMRLAAEVRTRMTAFSPLIVGMIESRKFARIVPIGIEKRPSCGKRASAMLSSLRIFRRETTARCSTLGKVRISRSVPSIRKRIRDSTSSGSMWMSVALSRSAK